MADHTIKDIEKVVKGIDGNIKTVNITRLSADGDNHNGLVYSVNFEVEKNGQVETITSVAKRIPNTGRGISKNAIDMKNEIRFYEEVVPLLKKFGKIYGISTEHFPEYLGSRLSLDETKSEADEETVLILENLVFQGYKLEDRFIGFDLPASKAILKSLASFHALPIAIKLHNAEVFEQIKSSLAVPSMKGGPPLHFKKDGPPNFSPHSLIDKLLEYPACQKYKKELETLKGRKRIHIKEPTLGLEPWNTLRHNDFWVTNILIKRLKGEEPSVKFIDFQGCVYSSFANDLVHFLLLNVENDVQKQHFDDLIRYYYDEFTSILNKLDIPELKLSYEVYLEELKNIAKIAETNNCLGFSGVVFGPKARQVFSMGHVNMADIGDVRRAKLELMVDLAGQRGWI